MLCNCLLLISNFIAILFYCKQTFRPKGLLMNESSAATIGGSDTDRRPEKPSIPALNRVIASVNIRLPGCIVLRSSWGKVLIRLLFRVVGLDISESPRRSIVLGPRALLPALSFSSRPLLLPFPPLPSFLHLSRFNSLESLYHHSVSSIVLSFHARSPLVQR